MECQLNEELIFIHGPISGTCVIAVGCITRWANLSNIVHLTDIIEDTVLQSNRFDSKSSITLFYGPHLIHPADDTHSSFVMIWADKCGFPTVAMVQVVMERELDGIMRGDERIDESQSARLEDRGFKLLIRDQSANRQTSVILRQRIEGKRQCE